jgi:threonine synthase
VASAASRRGALASCRAPLRQEFRHGSRRPVTQVPPVGSVSFGIEAYKTIAYEIQAQLGTTIPNWIAVPVA